MSQAQLQVAQRVSATKLAELAQMSGFQKIVLLNNLAGNLANGGWDAIEAQAKLIKSEYKEMNDEIDARNPEKLRGEIADMLVVIYGLAHRAGFDADADLHEVVLSNLTKFDASDDGSVQATVAKHLKNNVETVQLEVEDPLRDEGSARKLYVTKSAYDQTGHDNKSYPKGKWLKSAAFVEPQVAPLPLAVQDKLGMIKVHRNLGGMAFGPFVAYGEGGYYARAIDSFTVDNVLINEQPVGEGNVGDTGFGSVTVAKGDIMFIQDKDMNHTLPTGDTLEASTLVQQLDALPSPTVAERLVNHALNPVHKLFEAERANGILPSLIYLHINDTNGDTADLKSTAALYREIGDEMKITAEGREWSEFTAEVEEFFTKRGYTLRVLSVAQEIGEPKLSAEAIGNLIADCIAVNPVAGVFCTDPEMSPAITLAPAETVE